MNGMNIAKTLLGKRKERGITQEELAYYIGVSKASVSKWETGQSYPDITFLPQLASYFNISIDELICYEPQMMKSDIHKLYHKLVADFSAKPFDEVLDEIREVVKKYYSCFLLLFHMGQLLINHSTFVEETKRQPLIMEAMELVVRIKSECDDLKICKQANLMEATCRLLLNEPEKAIGLLEGECNVNLDENNLLALGYSMNQQPEKAKEILQIGIYQNLISMIQNLLGLLQQESAEAEKANVILQRILTIGDVFEIERLHPVMMLSAYILAAQLYTSRNELDNAFSMLQKYCDLAVSDIYPIDLHGDAFFDKITAWLSEVAFGTEAPLNDKAVRLNIVQGVTENPAFKSLARELRYKNIVNKLQTVI